MSKAAKCSRAERQSLELDRLRDELAEARELVREALDGARTADYYGAEEFCERATAFLAKEPQP